MYPIDLDKEVDELVKNIKLFLEELSIELRKEFDLIFFNSNNNGVSKYESIYDFRSE